MKEGKSCMLLTQRRMKKPMINELEEEIEKSFNRDAALTSAQEQ